MKDKDIRAHMEHVMKYGGCMFWVDKKRKQGINPCTTNRCIAKKKYGHCVSSRRLCRFAAEWLDEHNEVGNCESIW